MLYVLCAALIYGIVQGVTEWLPISSTGHLLLLERVLRLPVGEDVKALALVLSQASCILAVCVLYRRELGLCALGRPARKKALLLWKKLILASIPVALLGFFCGDAIKAHLRTNETIALSLIALGVLFLFSDRWFSKNDRKEIGTVCAVGIGAAQCVSLIPGVSRSGSSILGAQALGVEKSAATRFSFFLAIPAMAGASALETFKFLRTGAALCGAELLFLIVCVSAAFCVSLFALRFLLKIVRRRGFFPFGVYRIVLGSLVLIVCART